MDLNLLDRSEDLEGSTGRIERNHVFRDRAFLIPGTRAERIWVGYEKFLPIFDGAQKIFAKILWGAK